jgi:hypothetical protein
MVLTWDGAGYVFNTIQRGHPAIPNSRYSDYPFLAPVALLSFLINDARLLACIYGLVLAVLPLGSLLVSFYFLSSTQYRALRVWPVLGILLSVLPGQGFMVAEAVPAAQASWAIWAIVAADISGSGLAWLGALNLFVFFLHPSTALVYAVTGGLFLVKARVATRQRPTRLRRSYDDGLRDAQSYVGQANAWLGIVFVVLAAVRLWYALATANSYEIGEESFSENYLAFRDALPSLGMLPLVYLLGLTVLGGVTGRIPKQFMLWLGGLTLALFLVYGVGWAADPKVWTSAFSFRRFVLVGTLPLVIMGGLHWWYVHRSTTHDQSASQGLSWIIVGSSAVFLMVFATQSFTWRQELSRFEADLGRCDKPVATADDLPWIDGTPLHHWAATQLSCVVEGKRVKTVFALDPDVRGNKILLFPGTWFRRRNRWFTFESDWSPKGTE